MNKYSHSHTTNTRERLFFLCVCTSRNELFFSLSPALQNTQQSLVLLHTEMMGRGGRRLMAKEIDIPISEHKFFLLVDIALTHCLAARKFTH